MKNRVLLFIAFVMAFSCGCTVRNTLPEKTTAGEAYDVVVICDDESWRGDLSYAVCDLLEESAPGLTRPQGYFNIVKQVAPRSASDIDRKYPNLFVVSINPTVDEATYAVSNNL